MTVNRGVTLVEVLVALSVLAIGAVALSAWQLTMLRVAVATRERNLVLQVAESELQHRLLGAGSQPGCDPAVVAGAGHIVDCRAEVAGCLVTGPLLTCDLSPGHHPERVTVIAESRTAGGPRVVLSGLRARRDPP